MGKYLIHYEERSIKDLITPFHEAAGHPGSGRTGKKGIGRTKEDCRRKIADR